MKFFRRSMAVFALILAVLGTQAQNGSGKAPALDRSPMDMSYYPVNFPVLKIQDKAKEPLLARVIYSRPQRNGRKVFGELVEYGKVWRLGANEATEVEFYKDVKLNGKAVKKGRYTLFGIPGETIWTIILNKDMDTWGAFGYKEENDILRTEVKVSKTETPAETFTIYFGKLSSSGAAMYISWDDTLVTVPFSF